MATTLLPSHSARIRVWDLPLRLFHWLLVIAIALAFLSAEEGSPLNDWHILAGWVAGILIVFRIFWGFVGGPHSRFSSFVRPRALGEHVRDLLRGQPKPSLGHNALGALSVLLLLGVIAATVGTGVALVEDAHELIGWTLLGLIAVHVAAVFFMSFLTRDNLIRAMVTGRKSAADHPGAADARRPGTFALAAALIVLAATAFAVHRFDPLAFSLRSTEDYEHGIRAADRGEPGRNREHDRDRD